MDFIALYMSSDSENEESNPMAMERKMIRDKSNVLEIPSTMFVKLFRLSKEAFLYLLQEISGDLKTSIRSTAIPPVIKLATALRFFGQGGYQLTVGEDFCVGLAQQTVSVVLSEVSNAIENNVCGKWISLKMTEEEKTENKRHFYEKFGIPNVGGAIDGTHIQIIRPHKDEHLYFNRKLKHSINAMMICDHKMAIRSVDGRHGGASHDSHVWSISAEREYFQECYLNRDRMWLLGDSGYPLEPWLMTPYRIAPEGSSEAKFNSVHSKGRTLIERVFGLLKTRFRCLMAARELHYSPEKVVKFLNVCSALHNICIAYNVTSPEEEPQIQYHIENNIEFNDSIHSTSEEAKRIRDQIKNIL